MFPITKLYIYITLWWVLGIELRLRLLLKEREVKVLYLRDGSVLKTVFGSYLRCRFASHHFQGRS